jgi:N-acetylglucosaminyl-diphospho-decaprenol L-rhamnosyltransferase
VVKSKELKQSCEYSVVLVEYFSSEHIVKCLESIYKQSQLPKKIVIVINGIDKEYRKIISSRFPQIQLIDPNKNLGYAKAANLGISNTETAVVLTLNPDTQLEVDASKLSCEYLAKNSRVGSLGPQILESTGQVYPSARKEPSFMDGLGHALLGSFFPNNRFTKSYKNLNVDNKTIRNTDWLSGAALFLRREALDEIGGWDEDYFMYCEDIDLGGKLRKNRWVNTYFPEAKITHVQGVSTSRTPIKLLFEHHKSLYIYTKKKYSNNLVMKSLVTIFIALRFPMAVAAHTFRLNSSS